MKKLNYTVAAIFVVVSLLSTQLFATEAEIKADAYIKLRKNVTDADDFKNLFKATGTMTYVNSPTHTFFDVVADNTGTYFLNRLSIHHDGSVKPIPSQTYVAGINQPNYSPVKNTAESTPGETVFNLTSNGQGDRICVIAKFTDNHWRKFKMSYVPGSLAKAACTDIASFAILRTVYNRAVGDPTLDAAGIVNSKLANFYVGGTNQTVDVSDFGVFRTLYNEVALPAGDIDCDQNDILLD